MSRVVGRLLVEEVDRPESCLRGGLQVPLAYHLREDFRLCLAVVAKTQVLRKGALYDG